MIRRRLHGFLCVLQIIGPSDQGDTTCVGTLKWRHNERDDVSSHQRLDLFKGRSKKTSKLRVAGFCEGNPLVTVTRKMFPFDDVIMNLVNIVSGKYTVMAYSLAAITGSNVG